MKRQQSLTLLPYTKSDSNMTLTKMWLKTHIFFDSHATIIKGWCKIYKVLAFSLGFNGSSAGQRPESGGFVFSLLLFSRKIQKSLTRHIYDPIVSFAGHNGTFLESSGSWKWTHHRSGSFHGNNDALDPPHALEAIDAVYTLYALDVSKAIDTSNACVQCF